MLNFHKNELINATLVEFYKTFEHTLDTVDYVPEKYNAKIKEIYNYVFVVEVLNTNEVKSFTYSDIITNTIKIYYK